MAPFAKFDVHGGPPLVYVSGELSRSKQPYYLGIMHHIERFDEGRVRLYRHFAFKVGARNCCIQGGCQELLQPAGWHSSSGLRLPDWKCGAATRPGVTVLQPGLDAPHLTLWPEARAAAQASLIQVGGGQGRARGWPGPKIEIKPEVFAEREPIRSKAEAARSKAGRWKHC